MSENELRDALAALASPAQPPPGASTRIQAGVRRAARRRRVVLGSGVLVTGLAVTGGALWLERPGDGGSGPGAWEPPVSGQPITTLPYEAPECPVPGIVAGRGQMTTTLPALDDVTSIRLCPNDDDWSQMRVPPRPDELLRPPEALVYGLEDLEQLVQEIEPRSPDMCDSVDFFGVATGPILVVTHADGSRDALHAGMCLSAERYDDSLVDLGQVHDLVMELLDEQRASYSYVPVSDAYPLLGEPCRHFGATGPVEPGREWLVDGSACGHWAEDGDTPSSVLAPDVLERLNAAFAEARRHDRIPRSPQGFGFVDDDCIETDDEMPHLAVRTQRGDVVDLRESPCGWLHLDGWQPGTGWEVPTTFAELGVDVPE